MESPVSRLREFEKLKVNWDSYGGHPPTPKVLKASRSLVILFEEMGFPAPFVVPTADGGISFEWHSGDDEMSFFLNGKAEVDSFFIDNKSHYYEISNEAP